MYIILCGMCICATIFPRLEFNSNRNRNSRKIVAKLQRDNGNGKTKSIDTNAIKLRALTIYVLEKLGKGASDGPPVIHIKTMEHEKCSKSASKQKVRIGKLKIDNIKLSRHRLVGGERWVKVGASWFCMWVSLFLT